MVTATTSARPARGHEVPKAGREAVVAVTERRWTRRLAGGVCFLAGWAVTGGLCGQLPPDRADVMYHGYEGGGLSVGGPAVLVRKGVAGKASLWTQYYVDMISSASIDVVSTASPYSEKRVEVSGGVDYLQDGTRFGLGFVRSEEPDYLSRNVSFGISQDFFGDLTTVGLTYGRGSDVVRRRGAPDFSEPVKRASYRFDISQIVTPRLVVNANYEAITDEGYLNNPYRSVRYRDPDSVSGFAWQGERYPRTRTSAATAVRGLYRLPYRAAVRAEYRYFSDSWGIRAHNAELGYAQPIDDRWTVDLKYRYYTQGAADFFSDLFERRDAQNFLARDKELSTFHSHTFGAALGYERKLPEGGLVTKVGINVGVDWMRFVYSDFRDVTAGGNPGEEPAYAFDAYVFRVFASVWL